MMRGEKKREDRRGEDKERKGDNGGEEDGNVMWREKRNSGEQEGKER